MMWTVIGWIVAFSLGVGVGVWMRHDDEGYAAAFPDEAQGVDR